LNLDGRPGVRFVRLVLGFVFGLVFGFAFGFRFGFGFRVVGCRFF